MNKRQAKKYRKKEIIEKWNKLIKDDKLNIAILNLSKCIKKQKEIFEKLGYKVEQINIKELQKNERCI